MKWVLEKNKTFYFESNYFHQFRNFDVSFEKQMKQLEDLKKTMPPDEHLAIDLQKHFLLVAELLEAVSCVNNDNAHERLDPPADGLNESAKGLYQYFFGKLDTKNEI